MVRFQKIQMAIVAEFDSKDLDPAMFGLSSLNTLLFNYYEPQKKQNFSITPLKHSECVLLFNNRNFPNCIKTIKFPLPTVP